MIKIKKYCLSVAFFLSITVSAFAQSTINSPYSGFGVGLLKGSYLPQYRAMGNLAYGVSRFGAYNNVNVANPASYSQIRLTTFDVGATANLQKLTRGSLSEKSFNASLNHFVIAVPVNKKSALSFGLLPYSNLGYQFKASSKVDTFDVDQVYSGEGGLSKAYLGYGFQLGKKFNFGANLSYLFGNLKESRSTEFTKYGGFLNTRSDDANSVRGLVIDFATQYVTTLSEKTRFTVGYTGGVKTELKAKRTELTTRYLSQINDGTTTEFRSDTTFFIEGADSKLVLPGNHNVGFSIEKENKWFLGADFRMAKWSSFSANGQNPGLNDTYGFSAGGQITPNVNSIKYLSVIDYRFGVNYDKTYIKIGSQNIKSQSLNLGLGLPLASLRSSAFYKINFSAELGQRGTTKSNLVKENFYNFYLGFTINDRWFQKYKYD